MQLQDILTGIYDDVQRQHAIGMRLATLASSFGGMLGPEVRATRAAAPTAPKD